MRAAVLSDIHGNHSVVLCRVPVDLGELRRRVQVSGMPQAERTLKDCDH